MWRQLLHAQGNALLVVVEVEDYHIEFVVQLHQFLWMVHAAPAHVCDVDQSIDATQIYEHAVRSDVLDCSLQNGTFLQTLDDDALLLLQFCFNERFVRNNNVFEFLVDFDNLKFHLLSYIKIEITDWLHVNL